jgi:pentatricopeptide repeat protein
MPLREVRYPFHRTSITGIHFHSSLYNKNLLFCLYRLFTSNVRTIKQIHGNSFTVFTFKTHQRSSFCTITLDTHTSNKRCVTRVFHRIEHYSRKQNVAFLNFMNFRRQFSQFTILNSNSNAIQDIYHSKDIDVKSKIPGEPFLKKQILKDVKLGQFNEKVKKKLRKDSLYYNIITQNLHKFRNDSLKAYEVYTDVVKNGLLCFVKSHHMRMFLQIIYHNPNKKTFEWLIQIMKDFHSFNLKNRIPSDVYEMTLYKMVDLSNNNNSLPKILDALVEKSAFYGRVDAYRILIRIYCERGDVNEALYILRRVILFGQVPRKGLYSTLISELCKQGKLEIAEELLEEFEEYFDTPDIFLFTSLISGYSKKGEIDKIEKIFKKLLELGIQPDRKLYTTLIFAYLRCRNTRSACKIYEQIEHLKYDTYLFVSQIYMRAINSDSTDAGKIFEMMNAFGIMPNTETYNHLIYAYSRDNLIDTSKIENVYLQMLAQKVEPNHYTYELLIDAMCKRSNFLKAYRFLNEMKRKFPITNIALNPIIRHQTLGDSGDINNAIRLYNQMISNGIEPNLYIYTTIISLATVSSKHSLAVKVFKELLAKGHKPNVYVYSAFITSLVKAKKLQKAIKIFQQMVRDNVSLNHIPFTTLIQSFVMTRRFDDGKKLYEIMKKMNLKIDRFVYYHFEKLIERAHRKDELKYLYEDIERHGLDPKSRDRIYTKGKGPRYWKLKFLAQRRILRQTYQLKKKD